MSYSALATLLRSTAAKLASLPQSVAGFLAADETPLESVPEPFVPTTPSAPAAPREPRHDGAAAVATATAASAAAAAAEGLRPSPPPATQDPSSSSSSSLPMTAGTTLRERATGGANPSLLGDPVSLKAEQSALVPTPDEAGAPPASAPSSSSLTAHKELRREKAAKAAHGPGANPSMLGDPISMTSEARNQAANPEIEEGAMARRGSKL